MEETEKLCNANKTVKNYMIMSMGMGLIPIPIVDLVALSGKKRGQAQINVTMILVSAK